MSYFIQVVVDGLSNGAIYAAIALAIVLVYRATGESVAGAPGIG